MILLTLKCLFLALKCHLPWRVYNTNPQSPVFICFLSMYDSSRKVLNNSYLLKHLDTMEKGQLMSHFMIYHEIFLHNNQKLRAFEGL